MHGISHLLAPDDLSAAPPPTHGIKHAIASHPLAAQARWRNGDHPGHGQRRLNYSPILSRHDSIESLDQARSDYSTRLSHHSSMFSLASPVLSRPPPSPPRKAGSPGQIPAPSPMRHTKPSVTSSLLDLSSNPPIRLSPLDRSSSQLSLLYGARQEETLLEQARRISLGSHVPTPSPPTKVARHHSQVSPGAKPGPQVPVAAKMTRSQSHINGGREQFSHFSDRSRELPNLGLDPLDRFLESVDRVNNHTEFRLRKV